jgi:hypothetical protein
VVEEHGDRLPLPRQGGRLEGRSACLELHARDRGDLSFTASWFDRISQQPIPSLSALLCYSRYSANNRVELG